MFKKSFIVCFFITSVFAQEVCVEDINLLSKSEIKYIDVCINTPSQMNDYKIKHFLIMNVSSTNMEEISTRKGKSILIDSIEKDINDTLYLTKFSIHNEPRASNLNDNIPVLFFSTEH